MSETKIIRKNAYMRLSEVKEPSIKYLHLNKPNVWIPLPLYAFEQNNEVTKTMDTPFWLDTPCSPLSPSMRKYFMNGPYGLKDLKPTSLVTQLFCF